MPKLYLRQPGFTHSACRPFTKHHDRIQKFRKTADLKYIFKNKLDEACCAYDASYSDSKNLAKRTISDRILKDRAYEIVINLNYDVYQIGLASMVNKFFVTKTGLEVIAASKAGASVNEELAQELHKPVIKKFKRRKVSARFKDNIWVADLALMGHYLL